ncbi:hypothetical protein [Burkholderia ubonensis]|uniref:hypothetical protein n=1 Tax=Burkholderia ubonensis TaxID=101571 RepID=UPI0012F820D5|nr:hypothetical protein [Burkholderia ubonensis]
MDLKFPGASRYQSDENDRYEIVVARRAARETSSGEPAAQGGKCDEIAQLTELSCMGVFVICRQREERGAKTLHDMLGGTSIRQGPRA